MNEAKYHEFKLKLKAAGAQSDDEVVAMTEAQIRPVRGLWVGAVFLMLFGIPLSFLFVGIPAVLLGLVFVWYPFHITNTMREFGRRYM